MTSSSVFRLIVIVLAVVIPLNLLTLLLGSRAVFEAERQVSMEAQYSLQLYLRQVDDALNRGTVSMNSVSRTDEDFVRLRDKPVTGDEEYYRQIQAVVNLSKTLRDKTNDNSYLDGCFAVFPEKDLFVRNNNAGSDATEIKGIVLRAIEEGTEERFRRWRSVEGEQDDYLLLILEFKGARYGAWVSLRSLSENMDASRSREGEIVAFTDGEGKVLYRSGGDIMQVDLSSPEDVPGVDGGTLVLAASENSDLHLARLLPEGAISGALPFALRLMQVLSIASVLILPVIAIVIQHRIGAPMARLNEAMDRIEEGDIEYRIPAPGKSVGSEFERLNGHFNHMMDEVAELKLSVYEEQLKASKIKMGFLAQQIRPHFILNTLNILYSYEQEEHALSQRMILNLSKYFRYVVNANVDFVPLRAEMEHLRNYFEIQRARFPKTFRAGVSYEGDAGKCLVPPLLIQSFAENAIKHAFTPGEVIDISVTARAEGGRLYIRVSDTGAGIPDEVLGRIEEFRETREFRRDLGVGIQNSIDRIDLLYGGDAELSIRRGEPRGTLIDITVPDRREEDAGDDERDIG